MQTILLDYQTKHSFVHIKSVEEIQKSGDQILHEREPINHKYLVMKEIHSVIRTVILRSEEMEFFIPNLLTAVILSMR